LEVSGAGMKLGSIVCASTARRTLIVISDIGVGRSCWRHAKRWLTGKSITPRHRQRGRVRVETLGHDPRLLQQQVSEKGVSKSALCRLGIARFFGGCACVREADPSVGGEAAAHLLGRRDFPAWHNRRTFLSRSLRSEVSRMTTRAGATRLAGGGGRR
jgi:hypothetical protein